MSTYHVKVGGTKTSGTSADWTDAECYATLVAALTEGGDGDEFILNDETHEVNDISGTNWVGDRTISSRSGVAANCIVQTPAADGTSKHFLCNPGSAGSLIVNDIKFTRPATATATGNAVIQASGSMGDVTLNDCIMGDYDCTTATGAMQNAVLYSASGTARTMTLNNVTIQNMTLTSPDSYMSLYRQRNAADALVMTNLTLSNVNRVIDTSNDVQGWFYIERGDVTLTNVNISDCDATQNNAAGSNRAFFYGSSNVATNDLTVSGFHLSNCVFTGGASGIQGILWQGAYTATNLSATSCTSTSDANNTGLLFLAVGDSATGTASKLRVNSCTADFGLAFYASGGGAGEVSDVVVGNSSLSQGAVYFGGDGVAGTNSLTGYRACNLTTRSSPKAGETEGLGLYIHNNGDSDKTVTITSCDIAGCVNGENETEGIYIRNLSATNSLTVTVNDCRLYNGGNADREIGGGTDAGGGLTITTNDCQVQGGDAAVVDANTTNNNLTTLSTNPIEFIWDSSPANYSGQFASDSVINIAYNLTAPIEIRDLKGYTTRKGKDWVEDNL